jgi:hypothetical protein
VTLNQAAPLDENGKVIPGGGFSDTHKRLIIDAFLKACDSKDGIADGMV